MATIGTALLSAIAAFVGSWLAARFALERFRSEKIWERRAAVYTAIFEMLHDHHKWFLAHQDEMMHDRELTDEERERLSDEYRSANALLKRRVDAETWLVSDRFRERLEKLSRDLSKRHDGWFDHVEEGIVAVDAAIIDLRKIAREELNVPAAGLA